MAIISLIIPCRNEYKFIGDCLQQCLDQKCLSDEVEIIVADGQSDDGTLQILENYSRLYPQIKIIENTEKVTPVALNKAILAAKGEIVVRIDVHTKYDPDYVHNCILTLRSTGAKNVGGPWQAIGASYVQKAIALAFQSPFSSGGAGSHDVNYEGEVDSVYLGCWYKSALLDIGMFDEELVRNQDDELNYRIKKAGGIIWQTPKIKSWYFPRGSILALFRQYRQYGYWKVRVIQKHNMPASFRHIVPALFLFILLLLVLLSPFSLYAFWLFLFVSLLYVVLNMIASAITCIDRSNRVYFPLMPFIFSAYHFGYGIGFFQGFIDFIVMRKNGGDSFSEITRN